MRAQRSCANRASNALGQARSFTQKARAILDETPVKDLMPEEVARLNEVLRLLDSVAFEVVKLRNANSLD